MQLALDSCLAKKAIEGDDAEVGSAKKKMCICPSRNCLLFDCLQWKLFKSKRELGEDWSVTVEDDIDDLMIVVVAASAGLDFNNVCSFGVAGIV